MRITTWNVNGIRNPFGYAPWNATRTFPAMFDILASDIVVMQELKIQRKDLRDDMVLLDGWDCYFSLPKHKKGYSGVGIYTRNATCAPIKAEEGILGVLAPPASETAYRDLPESKSIGGYPSYSQIAELGVDPVMLDSEGRCVCLEFPAFVLFGVYSPANSNGLRDDFRYGFLCALDCRIRNLVQMGKRVVLVGDLNVSREEIDTANAVEDMRKEGLTHADYISTPNRRVFNQMLVGGDVIGERDVGREEPILCDLVREHHPTRAGMFTHWEQKINARPGNFGSRIDFILVCQAMQNWFSHADIQEGLMGSDHCPVYADFNDVVGVVEADGIQDKHILDMMSPSRHVVDGKRLVEWSIKQVPLLSGKLLKEFDRRRSIKDMFSKPGIKDVAIQTPSATTENVGAAIDNRSSTVSVASCHMATSNITSTGTQASLVDLKAPLSQATTVPSPVRKRSSTDLSDQNGVKRLKTAVTTKPDVTKGQRSLKGFFSSSSGTSPSSKATRDQSNGRPPHGCDNVGADQGDSGIVATAHTKAEVKTERCTQDDVRQPTPCTPNAAPDPPPPPLSPSPCSVSSSVHDPVATKDAWAAVMKKPAAPLCEHGEPCKSMLTKKKGENQGRSFWMCARPLGPKGQKESGSQWRCTTFKWAKEAKGDINAVPHENRS